MLIRRRFNLHVQVRDDIRKSDNNNNITCSTNRNIENWRGEKRGGRGGLSFSETDFCSSSSKIDIFLSETYYDRNIEKLREKTLSRLGTIHFII